MIESLGVLTRRCKLKECGKHFICYPDHVYKIHGHGSKRGTYCSWTCFRVAGGGDDKKVQRKHIARSKNYEILHTNNI